MTDAKRTGSRDISDLKQRLGLKKTGAVPGVGDTGAGPGAPRPQGGARQTGVVPPPGLNLPPPPGMPQPVQSQPMPVMPNAEHDPFGAMNAMAAVGQVQRAPEMIIVNDGKPVENVGQQSRGMTIAKIAVPAVVALLVGIGVGRRSQAANSFNDGLADAKAILGNTQDRAKSGTSTVAGLKRILSDVDSALDGAATKGFAYDYDLDKQLEALVGKLDVKSEAVFGKLKANALNDATAAQVVTFYAGVAQLKTMVDNHERAAKADALAYKKSKAKADAAAMKATDNAYLSGQPKYGVVVLGPTDADKTVPLAAQLVEIGPPYCGSTDANPTSSGQCQGPPSAFAYRVEPGGGWTKGDLGAGNKVAVAGLLTLSPSTVGDALVQGSEGIASMVLYKARLQTIYDFVHGTKDRKGLLDAGNVLEAKLSSEASKGSQFSFFM